MFLATTSARVRPIEPSDADGLARVFRAAWSEAYTAILPEAYLARLIEQRTAAWWRSEAHRTASFSSSAPPSRTPSNIGNNRPLLVEIDGVVAGYSFYGPMRGGRYRSGEIYELYVDPTYQGHGHGELLFEGCRHHLDERHIPGLMVWVIAANTRARAFYWNRGGRPVAERTDSIGGRRVKLVAYKFP